MQESTIWRVEDSAQKAKGMTSGPMRRGGGGNGRPGARRRSLLTTSGPMRGGGRKGNAPVRPPMQMLMMARTTKFVPPAKSVTLSNLNVAAMM